MDTQPVEGSETPEIAFYYPGPMWHSGDWVKNLVLFFDGIALLVPSYMKDRPYNLDPAIASGLQEHGLLHILEPETIVDKVATEHLVDALSNLIVSGALDDLARQETEFHELSYSRLGAFGDAGLAKMLLEDLKLKGLARDSEDGVSIPLHPMVRTIILVLLSQILRPYGSQIGIELSPATDQPALVGALQEVLSIPSAPSAGQVVSLDLNLVGVDLGAVPIDEVLSFREQNLGPHRAYARNVRQFVRELSLLPQKEREQAFIDRHAELREQAQQLSDASRKAWKKPASFGLSMVGAAWSLASGNLVGAAVGAGGAIMSAITGQAQESGAYSYLFRAQKKFPV